MTWVLEAFRDSDELLAWKLDLPDADPVTLAQQLSLPYLDASGGFPLSKAQARAAAALTAPAARQEIDLETEGLSFFITLYAA